MEMLNSKPGAGDEKDESTGTACFVTHDSTKVELEFAEYLQGLKLPLDNGTTGRVVEQRRRDHNGQMVYLCYPCGATLHGEYMVQDHVRGKKHLCKLASRETWPSSIHNHPFENPARTIDDTSLLPPAQSKSEEFQFDLSIVCNIQTHLDSFRSKSIIGLEYLVEILSNDHLSIIYNCVLCTKNASLDKMLQNHLVSPEHVLLYMSIHFSTVYIAIKANKLDRDPSLMRDYSDRLSQAIENSYGRLRPVQCTKEQWNIHRNAICRTVSKREHFSEKLGRTFAEIVTPVQHLNKDTKAVAAVCDKETVPFRTVGKREHFMDKLITTFVPMVAVKPLQDVTRGQNVVSATDQSVNTGMKKDVPPLGDVQSRVKKKDNAGGRSGHSPYGHSPLRDDKHTSSAISPEDRKKLFDKVKQYCERIQEELDDALKEMAIHEKNPEKHPQYPAEWVQFWNQRFMEVRAENKDTTTHDFKCEWVKYWPKRLIHLHNARIESTKKALREELGFDVNKSPTRDLIVQLPAQNDSLRSLISQSPQRRLRLPKRRSRSPRRRSRSQGKRSQSPMKLYSLQRLRSRSPRKRSSSPRRRSPLKIRRYQSPSHRKRSRSPKKTSRSPRRRSPLSLQRKRSLSPRRRSRSPTLRKRLPSPLQRQTRSPRKLYRSTESDARQRSQSPRKQTRSPFCGQAKPDPSKTRHADDTGVSSSQFTIPSHDDSLTLNLRHEVKLQSDVKSARPSEAIRRSQVERPSAELFHTGQIGSTCGNKSITESVCDGKCTPSQNNSEENKDCDDSTSCSSSNISSISTISGSICSERTCSRDADQPRDIVPVLRLLSALEDCLGPSLGPSVLKLLAKALRMEKQEPNSSWNILEDDANLELLEMCKEKLRGKMEVGLLENAALSASLEAIVRTTALLERNDRWRRRARDQEMVQNRVNSVDKVTLLRHIEEALVRQGKMDVTTQELATLVDSVVDVAERRRQLAQVSNTDTGSIETPKVDDAITTHNFESKILQDANESKTEQEEISYSMQDVDLAMDALSDCELRILMKNFRHLEQEEQERLVSYINMLKLRNPKRTESLRRFMRLGVVEKNVSDIDKRKEESQNTEGLHDAKEESCVEVNDDLQNNKIVKSETDIKQSSTRETLSVNTQLNKEEIDMPQESQLKEEQTVDDVHSSQEKTATSELFQQDNTKRETEDVLQMESKKERNNTKLLQHKQSKNMSTSQHKKQKCENLPSHQQGNLEKEILPSKETVNLLMSHEKTALLSKQEEIPDSQLPHMRKKKLQNDVIARNDNSAPRKKISMEDYLFIKHQKSDLIRLKKESQEKEQKPETSQLSRNKENTEKTPLAQNEEKTENTKPSKNKRKHKTQLPQNEVDHEPTNLPQQKNKPNKFTHGAMKKLLTLNKEDKPDNTNLRIGKEQEQLQNTHSPVVKKISKQTQAIPVRMSLDTPQNKEKPNITQVSEENEQMSSTKKIQSKNTQMPPNLRKPINTHLPQEKELHPENPLLPQSEMKKIKNDLVSQQNEFEPENTPSSKENMQKLQQTRIPQKSQHKPKLPKESELSPKNTVDTLLMAKQKNYNTENFVMCQQKEKNAAKVVLPDEKKMAADDVVVPDQKTKDAANIVLCVQRRKEAGNVILPEQKKKGADNVLRQQKKKIAENVVLPLHNQQAVNIALPKQKNKEVENVVQPEQKEREEENVVLPQQKKKKGDNVTLREHKNEEAENFVLSEQKKKEAENIVLPEHKKKKRQNVVLLQHINKNEANVMLPEHENEEAENAVVPVQKEKEAENVVLPEQKKKKGQNVVLPESKNEEEANVMLLEHKNEEAENVVLPVQKKKEAGNVRLPEQKKKKAENVVMHQHNEPADNMVLPEQKEKVADNVLMPEQRKKKRQSVVLPENINKEEANVMLPEHKNEKAENVVLPVQKKKEADNVLLPEQKKKGAQNIVLPEQKNKKENKNKEEANVMFPQHKHGKAENVVLPVQKKKEADNVLLPEQKKKEAQNIVLPEQKNKKENKNKDEADVILSEHKHGKAENVILAVQTKKEADNVLLTEQKKKEAENIVLRQHNKQADNLVLPKQKEKVAENVLLSELKKKEADNVVVRQKKKKDSENVVLPQNIKQDVNVVLPRQKEKETEDIVLPKQKRRIEENLLPEEKKKKAANDILREHKNEEVENVPDQKKETENVVLSEQKKKKVENIVWPEQNKKEADNVVFPEQKNKKEENVVSPEQKKMKVENVVLSKQNKKEEENVVFPEQKNIKEENVVLTEQKKKKADNVVLPEKKKKEAESVVFPEQEKEEAVKTVLPQQKQQQADNVLLHLPGNKQIKKVVSPQQNNKEAKNVVLPKQKNQDADISSRASTSHRQNEEKIERPILVEENQQTVNNKVLPLRKAEKCKKTQCVQRNSGISSSKVKTNQLTASQKIRDTKKQASETTDTFSHSKKPKTVPNSISTDSVLLKRKPLVTGCSKIANSDSPPKKSKFKANSGMTDAVWMMKRPVQNLAFQKLLNNRQHFQQQNCRIEMPSPSHSHPNERMHQWREAPHQGNLFRNQFTEQRMSFPQENHHYENNFAKRNQFSVEKVIERPHLQRNSFQRERFSDDRNFVHEQFPEGGFNGGPILPERNFGQRRYEERDPEFLQPENFRERFQEPEIRPCFINRNQFVEGPRFSSMRDDNSWGPPRGFSGDVHGWNGSCGYQP